VLFRICLGMAAWLGRATQAFNHKPPFQNGDVWANVRLSSCFVQASGHCLGIDENVGAAAGPQMHGHHNWPEFWLKPPPLHAWFCLHDISASSTNVSTLWSPSCIAFQLQS
jgi:hypothetical protein